LNLTARFRLTISRALCADAMWAEDDASKGLGMEIVDVGPVGRR